MNSKWTKPWRSHLLSYLMRLISMICSCMLCNPLNFIVMNYAINIHVSDLLAEWKCSSTNLKYSLTLSICGMVVSMVFIIVIQINIMLNLLDHFHALSLNIFSSVLSLVTTSFSSKSDKSKSKTFKWNSTYSLHSKKFKSLKMLSKWREIATNK